MARSIFFALLCMGLAGCSYVGTMLSQAEFAHQLRTEPQQRVSKHMLDRQTWFVFGRIGQTAALKSQAMAVLALSDRFRTAEVVDVNHTARADSYYGLNLPAGQYRLLVVADLDGNGFYDESEVLGSRNLALAPEAVPDMVAEGIDIDLATERVPQPGAFRVAVETAPPRSESLFYPRGTLRTLDDPIFGPQMADLGLYRPAAFLEAAPMLFYALEEDYGYKIPVVFVHGIGGSARDFGDVVAALDRTRYRPWFFHYPSGASLEQLGAMFHRIFLSGKVIPLEDMPLVIVAHSMGGLVVREALNLQTGARGENRVARLITLASPLGGHPGARSASGGPVVIPSWRDLNPDGPFVARLHRKPLPAGLEYRLLFAYGDERPVKVGRNSDGVVPLASQLSAAAQKEATAQHGYDTTHTGILSDPAAIADIIRLAGEVRSPFPEAHVRELLRGGYPLGDAAGYSALEAHFIRNLGRYMDAIAAGRLAPFHPSQAHFIRAVRGEIAADNPAETAWIKFTRGHPDRLLSTPELR